MIIDSHVHLWKTQHGRVDGRPVFSLGGGKSDFGGEVRQMTPPYMLNGENTAEMLIANMDYAGVCAAVVTQEEIDGNQDAYLLAAKEKFPARLQICSLYEEGRPFTLDGFDGVKLCAGRFPTQDLTKHAAVFEAANNAGKFVFVELADGDRQTGSLAELIQQFPDLRIAIGHFGMVTRDGWREQIRLARAKNVRVESGGITWLFHRESFASERASSRSENCVAVSLYSLTASSSSVFSSSHTSVSSVSSMTSSSSSADSLAIFFSSIRCTPSCATYRYAHPQRL